MKTSQLQIRLSPEQKARLRERAAGAGQELSTYVLSRVLPPLSDRFESILETLREGETPDSFALADLNDLLTRALSEELRQAVEHAALHGLSPLQCNLLAAMVEQACHGAELPPPRWCRTVPALEAPWFAAPLKGLRPYLLSVSPVAFRRRNLFVDSTVGDRV